MERKNSNPSRDTKSIGHKKQDKDRKGVKNKKETEIR